MSEVVALVYRYYGVALDITAWDEYVSDVLDD